MTLSHFDYYPNAYSWKARTQIIKSDFSCHLYIVLHENNFVILNLLIIRLSLLFFFAKLSNACVRVSHSVVSNPLQPHGL